MATMSAAPLVDLAEVVEEEDDGEAAAAAARVLPTAEVEAEDAVDAEMAEVDELATLLLAEPSLPCAAARTDELKVPDMPESVKRAEKDMAEAVPLASVLDDSILMKLRAGKTSARRL